MERAWILVGMMGSGKSSIGRTLALLSGREFLDTDILIANRFGRPVHQVFAIYGEDAFRAHETSVLKTLQPGPYVIATGGGIVMKESNWHEMHRLGTVIHLRADAATIKDRLSKSKKRRPLIEVVDWESRVEGLLDVRAEAYQRADLTVSVDGLEIAEVAKQVLSTLQTEGTP